MMTRIKQRWQNYSKREQLIFTFGGLALLGLIVSQGIVAPLNNYQQQSEKTLLRAQRDFAALLQQQPRINSLQAQQPPQFALSAGQAAHEGAHQKDMTITLLEANMNRVVVAPFTLPFPKLLNWLEHLEKQYGLQASELKLAADANNLNQVHISTLVLQRAGVTTL
ncbi:putative general secretion pathway protein M [Yersinia aldovae]|uniref:Putative general secretion pathway protein M n=1 Tax=Yersinia aldovae TaxID=29483 RepID=A0A0T9UWJ6_YERAL|nr:type II secretion system protein GspM [Yersinia aldovae]CNL78714.1 putative general secretion pathway protein M [Yersinia aldovae]